MYYFILKILRDCERLQNKKNWHLLYWKKFFSELYHSRDIPGEKLNYYTHMAAAVGFGTCNLSNLLARRSTN